MEKKFDPKQVIIDRRSALVDLAKLEKFLRVYTGRKFNSFAYEKSWEIVKKVTEYCQDSMSDEDRIVRKILVDDVWIWYKDLRNPSRPCPGDNIAVRYIKIHNRLHPECEKCRKILVFDLDENFLRRITEEFLAKPFTFDFKISRDLSVLVSYSRGDGEKDRIIAYFENFLNTYGLNSRVQWRIGGRYLQKAAPHLFKSAKILSYNI
jgi:hypothetical protein